MDVDKLVASVKSDQTREYTKWVVAFLRNMPCADTFEPTDEEADQMWKAFFEGDHGIVDAWSCAARIWEARERAIGSQH